MKILSLALILPLAACGGVSIGDAMNALKNDSASVCITVTNSYPPFQNQFTLVRSATGGSEVGSTPCALIHGGAAQPPLTPGSAVIPSAPVRVQ
jgi:hypothetical protein